MEKMAKKEAEERRKKDGTASPENPKADERSEGSRRPRRPVEPDRRLRGTFDPVHHGHLVMAQEAVVRLRLERMLFMALNRPPHKSAPHLAPVEHRIAMLRLATRGTPASRSPAWRRTGEESPIP